MSGFTRPSPPTAGRTLGDAPSELTKKFVREGCAPLRPRLTDAMAMVERLEQAAGPGRATNAQRRRLMIGAAQFIRERLNVASERREAAE